MIMISLIQACLFVLGIVPFLCELSRHFYDSFFTMLARFVVFLITIICGYYAPYLQKLPDILLVSVTIVLIYLSLTTIQDVIKIYRNKIQKDKYDNTNY